MFDINYISQSWEPNVSCGLIQIAQTELASFLATKIVKAENLMHMVNTVYEYTAEIYTIAYEIWNWILTLHLYLKV